MNFFEKHRLSISILMGLIFSLIVAIFWSANNKELDRSLQSKVTDTNRLVTQQLRDVLLKNVNRLENLKRRIELTEGEYFQYWNQDASMLIDQDPSFRFVEWIDSSMVIQLVEPKISNQAAIGLDISALDYRRDDWNRARNDSVFNFTHWVELVQGDYAFLVDAPVYIGGEFQGTITAGMDFTDRFNKIMEGLREYHINIQDDRQNSFYLYGDSMGTEAFTNMAVTDSIQIDDANRSVWTVTMIPNHIFAEQNATSSYPVSLILALLLCLLLAVSFFYMQKSSVAEKNSRRTAQRLRALIDSAPLAIYVLDSEGRVVDLWNDAAENMLGWNKGEVMNHMLPTITEEREEEFDSLMDQISRDGGLAHREIVRTRKDGTDRHFRLNVGDIVGEDEHMIVLLEDITKEKQYEKQLRDSLREKNILLAEIHHRVKNNLAIIVGLIELHANDIDDIHTQALLAETKNRIFSISEVHELLYETENFSEISFGEYLDTLIDRVQRTYRNIGTNISIRKDISDFHVNINQAIPLGLLLNELVTNSYKHAFNETDGPEIYLDLHKEEEQVYIIYKDNGNGFNNDIFEEANSLGISLIRTLLRQLHAEYELLPNDGFGLRFHFSAAEEGAHANM